MSPENAPLEHPSDLPVTAADPTPSNQAPDALAAEIRRMAADLFREAERIRSLQESSQLQQSMMELQQSTQQLRTAALASTSATTAALTSMREAVLANVPVVTPTVISPTLTPIAPAPGIAPSAPAPAASNYSCGEKGSTACGCVSSNCCCFTICISRVRVTTIGGLGGLVGEGGVTLELQLYSSIEGIGTLFPNLNSHIAVRGKLNGPGSWVDVKKTVREICIPKGGPKSFTIHTEVKEKDKIFKDDIGSHTCRVDLDCCCALDRVETDEVELKQGEGNAVIGIEFLVKRIC